MGSAGFAQFVCHWAAWVKTTSFGQVRYARNISDDGFNFTEFLDLRIGYGNGRKERTRVRMERILIKFLPIRILNHLTEVHNGNMIANVPYYG